MLQIKSTKKLLDELKIKPTEIKNINPIFSWHANIVLVSRRKTIFLINDATRMIIVLYGLKAANFKKLDSLILISIEENLLEGGIDQNLVNKYMDMIKGEVVYTKTDNRSILAALNQTMPYTYYGLAEVFDAENINQIKYNMQQLNYITKIGENYEKPIVLLNKYFDELGKENPDEDHKQATAPKNFKAYEFHMRLDLYNYNVWRNVIVPANISFKKFHNIIQDAFGWFDYHLHEFVIFNDDEEPKPVSLIVMNKGTMDDVDDLEVNIETVKLEKFIPKYSKILYSYDFGDGWEVTCDFKRVIEDYKLTYATCIDGEGDAPPEDVGGEPGFTDFLRIINDKKDPEHKEMVKWGKEQGYEKWNMSSVNKRLEKSLKRIR